MARTSKPSRKGPSPPGAPKYFWRVAVRRYEDARFLHDQGGTAHQTAALYLAGYAVECALKALLLTKTPESDQPEVIRSFKGQDAHNYDWLKAQIVRRTGAPIPKEINRKLLSVNSWSTDLRYDPGLKRDRDVRAFLASTIAILEWVKGRL